MRDEMSLLTVQYVVLIGVLRKQTMQQSSLCRFQVILTWFCDEQSILFHTCMYEFWSVGFIVVL